MSKTRTSYLVKLSNAGVRMNNRWLVRGIDLEVSAGEIVTLIGPNGSGKSTTAKIALGVTETTEGRVQRKDRLKVGYVPQKMPLDWSLPLTVERFMALTNKLSAAERDWALEAAEVRHLLKSEIQHLSGGELQRVLFARAIARKPELLVLDEPAQGVDFNGEIALYELIRRIRSELAAGVLLVSHDLHVVMAATDRVLCLNGHVCCSGTPTAVAENSEYKALFGKNAGSALAIYAHAHDHTHLPDGRVQHTDGTVTDHCHPDDGHHDEPESFKEKKHAG